jgi:hypothetical protein
LAGGIVMSDGALVVPPTPSPVYVTPVPMNKYSVTQPSTKRGNVIIIPKNLLDKKVKDLDKAPQKVALAQ